MGGVATFEKRFSFPKIWSQNFVIATKAAKAHKLGVRDGLFGVFRVGGGKQKITV